MNMYMLYLTNVYTDECRIYGPFHTIETLKTVQRETEGDDEMGRIVKVCIEQEEAQ